MPRLGKKKYINDFLPDEQQHWDFQGASATISVLKVHTPQQIMQKLCTYKRKGCKKPTNWKGP